MSNADVNDLKTQLWDSLDFIYRVIRGFIGNVETAKDLTSEAVLRIWKQQRQFRGQSSFQTWAYRIAVNVALNHCRRPQVDPLRLDWYDRAPASEDIRADIRQALSKLDEEKRDVLVLYFFCGYGVAEIAEKLDIPLGTANSRLERAKTELKAILKQIGYDYEA